MIRYFDRNETSFDHNKTILNPISCYITEEANGLFELEAEFAKNVNITEGDIIKAPSPRGDQLFRIYRVKKSLKGKTAYARHIFYDLSKNFLIDVNLNYVSGFTAIHTILDGTETAHNFTGTSDILTMNSAEYMRINPVQAIIGDENSILNKWGGNLVRDNFNIDIKAEGLDRGYEIRMGKNLIGIDADIDESNVKTRIYPTVAMDDSTITLPEKYVDSPYINNYGKPIIYTVEVKLTDDEKQLYADEQISMNDIYQIMRDYCNGLFETDNIDKPVINYKVDFVELSKTEQYKDLAILEQLDLYDIVTVNVSYLDINVKARVIKYKYDCLKDRYDSIELGDFSSTSSYTTEGIVSQIANRIKANETAVEYATNVITGNKGGYVVSRRYPDGKPYEILIMDTEDINTAVNVLRMNNSGIGFSQTGYNGTYGTAMTIDGHIVADYIDTGTLTSILLKSQNYITNTSGMQLSLTDGTIDSKNFKVDSYGNIISTGGVIQSGNYISGSTGTKINLLDGTIDSKNFKVDSYGNILSTGGVIQSSNYISDSIGMKINLADGTIDSKNFKVDSNGKITATEVDISGDITGSTITGSVIQSVFNNGSADITLELNKDNYWFAVKYGTQAFCNMQYAGIRCGASGAYAEYLKSGINIGTSLGNYYFTVDNNGAVNCSSVTTNTIYSHEITGLTNIDTTYINSASPITSDNIGDQSVASSSSCSTGYLTLSGGTLVAPSGSLYIGQNTVKANTIEQLSSESFKKNINPYQGDALSLICGTVIKTFNYNNEDDGTKLHLGMIVEEAPKEVISASGESLDIGALTSLAWKAIQEQHEIVQEQQTLINSQADKINELEQRLSKLEVA